MSEPARAELLPIENQPLRVVVADMLRELIVNGRIKPGTPIVETALSEQLAVSRAPVREAIQILEADGLVENVAYKGKRVKPLTAKSVEEVYSLREQLEVFAITRIVERRADVAELHGIVADMQHAADNGDFAALMAADENFHRTIIRLADHELLLTLWGTLFLRIRQIMALRNSANPDLGTVARNHPPIVAALQGGDLERAIALISAHSRSASELNLAALGVDP